MPRILKWIGVTLAALVLAVVLLAMFFDWNWLRGPVSSIVSKELDRRFAIKGDLDVDLSMTPRITANQIELANTSWGSHPEMLDLDRLEFTIRLEDLFTGDIVLPEIHLSEPRLVLEKNAQGQENWAFGDKKKKQQPAESPRIGQLTIKDGKIVYRDPTQQTEADMVVSTGIDRHNRQSIKVRGHGQYKKSKLEVLATAGSLLSLKEKLVPYPIDIEISFGSTKITAKGTLKDPVKFQDPDLTYTIQGNDLSEFDPVIGISLPKTPPYKLSGHLTRPGEEWVLKDFKGFVGNSDLRGDVVYTTRDKRPFLQADLASMKLDFKDLGGFVGAEPAAPEKTESKRVFSDRPYDLKALRNGDADVKFKSKNIITPKLPVDEFVTHLQLDHGVLKLEPMNFGIDIGQITSNITLDGREDKFTTKANLEIRKIPLKRLLADTRFAEQSEGTFFGRVRLATTGNSMAEMMGYADGDIAIIMESGRISNLLVELIGLDIAESLGFLLTKDPSIPIRCIIADFMVLKGVMKTQAFIIDTTDTNVISAGQINLRDESLDMRLTAHPKNPSILSARTPLIITGTLKEPNVRPEITRLAARAAASVALGVLLTPIAGIIPWIELGLGEDSQCHALINAAKQDSAVVPPKTIGKQKGKPKVKKKKKRSRQKARR